MSGCNWTLRAMDVLLQSYGLVRCEVQEMSRDGVNRVARVDGERGRFFVKEFGISPRLEAEVDLRRFVETLGQLAIPCAAIVPDLSGRLLARSGTGVWQLSKAADGEAQKILSRAQVRVVGNMLNKLHSLTRTGRGHSYTARRLTALDNSGVPDRWIPEGLAGQYVDSARELFETVGRLARSAIEYPLPLCQVHGEVGQSNLLFLGDDLAALIDFDCAGVDSRLVDFGRALVFLPRRKRGVYEHDPLLYRALWQSLIGSSPLCDEELECLPFFLAAQFVPDPAYLKALWRKSPGKAHSYLDWATAGARFVQSKEFEVLRFNRRVQQCGSF